MTGSLALRQATIQPEHQPDLPVTRGLAGHFDASSRTITDLHGTPGDPLLQWNDDSGNARHVVSATGKRPRLYTTAINGRPAIWFDGTDDHFATSGTFTELLQPNTIFVVAHGTDKGAGRNILDGDTATGKRNAIFWEGSNGKIRTYAGSGQPEINNVEAEPWTNPLIINSEFNGGLSVVRRSGHAMIATGVNPGTNGITKFRIGTYNESGGMWYGYIAEVIVYNRLLSTAEQNAVGAYLVEKYALAWTDIPETAHLPDPPMSDGVNTGTSLRASVTLADGASNFAEGTKVELDASLSADCGGIILALPSGWASNGADRRGIIAIYTGGSGSEVLWGRVNIGCLPMGHQIHIPGFWAAGTRITATLQTVASVLSVIVVPTFLPALEKHFSASPALSMGFVTSASTGTTLTTAGSNNTKTAWTELTAATTADLAALIVGFNQVTTTLAATDFLIDVGIGAAGAETVLIPDIHVKQTAIEQLNWAVPQTYLVNVPAGSRLSMRYSVAATGSQSTPAGTLTGILAA